jgi:polysaccharide pyruvyl transferase WcaK-like protein
MSVNSITLLGSSSGRNAGDAAILSAIMASVDAACGRELLYEIPTIRPEFVWKSYKNHVRPVSVLPWDLSLKLLGLPTYRSVNRTNMSLIFDAVLFDRALYNPFFNFLSSLYLLLPSAKKRGRKLGFFNVTAGPIRTPRGKKMLLELSEQMDFITVRDKDSYDILRDIGVQNPNMLVTADAALNAPPADETRVSAIWKELGLDEGEEVLAINVNPYFDSWAGLDRTPLSKEEFVATYSAGLNRIVGELGVSVLFVSTQHLDEDLTQELMAKTRGARKKALLSNRVYDHHDIKGVLGRVGLLFAMRLHCLILASSALAPISALNYLPKVLHYFKSLGLEKHTLNFDAFSSLALEEQIRRAWEERAAIRRELTSRIPALQERARWAADIIAAMDRGESVENVIHTHSS